MPVAKISAIQEKFSHAKVSGIGNFRLSLPKRMDMDTRIHDIGTLIQEERIRRGLTQEDLGKRVGVGKAQISKIENGRSLTIKTIMKVLDTLNLSASVKLHPAARIDRRIIGYIIANIGEFASTHGMTVKEASNYLNRYKGLDFLAEHFEAEHLLSLPDSVEDLTRICFNNGGGIR